MTMMNEDIDNIVAFVADFELKEHQYMELQKQDEKQNEYQITTAYEEILQGIEDGGALDEDGFFNVGPWTDTDGQALDVEEVELFIDTYYDLCEIREQQLDNDGDEEEHPQDQFETMMHMFFPSVKFVTV